MLNQTLTLIGGNFPCGHLSGHHVSLRYKTILNENKMKLHSYCMLFFNVQVNIQDFEQVKVPARSQKT